jgi:ABC-2 type transport system ATP-binding protein
MNSAIEVSKLTKYYGELIAVDQVSFEVKRGEIFGFLGPNGAGKTTTVRMLTGIIKPDGGTARVMGYDIQKEPLRAKQIMGIVPEMSNAYVELSAWDNLMLIGELYGIPGKKREEKGEKLLKDFGLYERRKQLVRGFSKGMKQRLLLCMALINEPRVLFLDEPTSGLDVESARMIKSMIRDLNKDGVTVFLTTHNMEEANQLCDRVAIINRGKIVAIDSPEKLRVRSSGLQSIVVSFDKPVNDKEISRISTVSEVVKMGDKIKLYTSNPGVVVPALVDLARSRGLKIVSLNTLTPSLEDVFVKLSREPAG